MKKNWKSFWFGLVVAIFFASSAYAVEIVDPSSEIVLPLENYLVGDSYKGKPICFEVSVGNIDNIKIKFDRGVGLVPTNEYEIANFKPAPALGIADPIAFTTKVDDDNFVYEYNFPVASAAVAPAAGDKYCLRDKAALSVTDTESTLTYQIVGSSEPKSVSAEVGFSKTGTTVGSVDKEVIFKLSKAFRSIDIMNVGAKIEYVEDPADGTRLTQSDGPRLFAVNEVKVTANGNLSGEVEYALSVALDNSNNWDGISRVFLARGGSKCGDVKSDQIDNPSGTALLVVDGLKIGGSSVGSEQLYDVCVVVDGQTELDERDLTGVVAIEVAKKEVMRDSGVFQTWRTNGYVAEVPNMRFNADNSLFSVVRIVNHENRPVKLWGKVLVGSGAEGNSQIIEDIDLGEVKAKDIVNINSVKLAEELGLGDNGNFDLKIRGNSGNLADDAHLFKLESGWWSSRRLGIISNNPH